MQPQGAIHGVDLTRLNLSGDCKGYGPHRLRQDERGVSEKMASAGGTALRAGLAHDGFAGFFQVLFNIFQKYHVIDLNFMRL